MTSIDVPVWHKLALTSAEAGALTGRDPRDISSYCELGIIRASRDRGRGRWRIPRTALDAWVDAGQPTTTGATA